MNNPSESVFRLRVDPTNPGQFFACCGLLELADRLWGGAEGWFENDDGEFALGVPESGHDARELVTGFVDAGLSGDLTPVLQRERHELETRKRQLRKNGTELPQEEEQRRDDLGKLLRAGPISIGKPFHFVLDWWLNQREKGFFSAIKVGDVLTARQDEQEADDDAIPKTWAGTQQVLRIAQAALVDTARAFETREPFDFKCVMRPVSDQFEDERAETGKRRGRKKGKDKVEPFYFDSRHGANALPLDIGFSPNELGMESKAFPAVELLCLIGLQRCRPRLTDAPLVFEYFTWSVRLQAPVLSAAVSGFLGQRVGYRFENAYRTDQKKHSGYLQATVIRR
jgi:CRISPR-associated protein Csb3